MMLVDFGGLNVGNVRVRNKALLAKWLWHLSLTPYNIRSL